MALEITENKVVYIGNNTASEFSVPFPVFQKTDLKVSTISPKDEKKILILGVDYTIRMQYQVVFSYQPLYVDLIRPLAAGWRLEICRIIPMTQEMVLSGQKTLSIANLEKALDKLTMICQQISSRTEELVNADFDGIMKTIAGIKENLQTVASRLEEKSDRRETETLLSDCNKSIQELFAIIADVMPAPPDDEQEYVAKGKTWVPLTIQLREPFHIDAQGYVVPVDADAFAPNSIWDISPRHISVSSSARIGDDDSLFLMDSAGHCVLKS